MRLGLHLLSAGVGSVGVGIRASGSVLRRHLKVDRNLLLAGIGVVALGAGAAFAQSANPGAISSQGPVTLGPGSAIAGKVGIDQTTPGTTNKVSLGTDAVNVPLIGATSTNGSSTVTTAATFQTALAASATRKGCFIQNPLSANETLYVQFGGGTASNANSVNLGPGGIATCAIGGNYVEQGPVQISAATAGHAYTLTSQ